jgi:galactokinase
VEALNVPARVQDLLGTADVAARAPGRANLIGEHTDYNEGFVLPIAIDLATYVVGKRDTNRIALASDQETAPIDLVATRPEVPASGWGRYVAGVALALADAGIAVRGLRGSVTSEVPVGAGLSSSAALEVAFALCLTTGYIPTEDLAQVCRRAENQYVGVSSGVMDQLTSAGARAGDACLIDCRTNEISYVPWPETLKVLIVDSGEKRQLDSGRFNERVRECSQAARALGAPTLRDVCLDQIEAATGKIDEVSSMRARHVVGENARTLAAADALRAGDEDTLGSLFAESHRSYSRDFEASTPAIDRLVEIAGETPGVVASRLTGGGWGGCTISLIRSEAEPSEVGGTITQRYGEETGNEARWWVTGAAGGAERLI